MAFLDSSRWEGKIFTTGGWMPGSGGEYDAVEPATMRGDLPQYPF